MHIRTLVLSATSALVIAGAGLVSTSFAALTPTPPGPHAIKVVLTETLTGIPLAGGTFALTQEGTKGTIKYGTVTTDAAGTFCIEGLAEGTYAWTETRAPQGYDKPDKKEATKLATTNGLFGNCLDEASVVVTRFQNSPSSKN